MSVSHQAGAYLVEGFANGITENTFMAEAKARAMARAAADAAEDELDEHSPSRVGYHIGRLLWYSDLSNCNRNLWCESLQRKC